MKYFDTNGRRIPSEGMRVFGKKQSNYYKIDSTPIDYRRILDRSKKFNNLSDGFSLEEFKSRAESLLNKIKSNDDYKALLNGVHIPFVLEYPKGDNDLGADLEKIHLPNLQKSFNDRYPESHFKAILQSNSVLPGNIHLDPVSQYENLIEQSNNGPVVGWYFPQALQEYDVKSQRLQMKTLPEVKDINVCLSGGMDICSALVAVPELLISDENYAPILCMSAYVHADERLVLLIKSYGPHMEFWCMTQMLTKDTTQVSEQWTGGLTIYC